MTGRPRAFAAPALAALVLAGCGASRPHTTGSGDDADVPEDAGAVRVLALPRPTEGRVWLSLWVDAGARDAEPPQVATAAAWLLDPSGRALADGIELRAETTSEGLGAQLDRWAARLSTRSAGPEALAQVRSRLTQTRRALGHDEARRADTLALQALTGSAVDPLGDPADDRRVDAATVAGFLADEVGAGRVLLVAVGDVTPDALRREAERAFADLPRARTGRDARPRRDGPTLRLAVGDDGAASLATAHPDLGHAAAHARRLLRRLEAEEATLEASADVFPLGGQAVSLVRVAGSDEAALTSLLGRAVELAEEPSREEPVAPPLEAPALAAWHGARWVGGEPGEAPTGPGLGVVVDGGRGDRLAEDDPDRVTAEAATTRLERLLAEVTRGPALDGQVDGDRGEARVENGAHLLGQRVPTLRRAAVAVVFQGGPAEEPPDLHGASAWLARLATEGCDAVAQRELGSDLAGLGVRASPIVRTGAWGLALDGPPEATATLAALAPRCAAAPPPAHAIEGSRADAVEGADPSLAQLAGALSAEAPGRIALEGSPRALARMQPPHLARWARQSTVGARTRVAVVSPEPIGPAMRRTARVIATWPSGAAAGATRWTPPTGVRAAPPRPEGARAWIAWTAPMPPTGAGSGASLASAAARALRAAPGVRVLSARSGYAAERAWAAVELACTPDALDGLRQRVTAIAALPVEEDANADASTGWAGASALGLAARVALGRAPSRRTAQESTAAMRASEPLFLIARPAPTAREE